MNQDDPAGGLRGFRATPSPELIEAVCDAYRFDKLDDVVDLGGSSSLNLLIDDGGRRYVVRVYRPYVTKARLNDIQHVRRELVAYGAPCSDIFLTQNEQPWIVFDVAPAVFEAGLRHPPRDNLQTPPKNLLIS